MPDTFVTVAEIADQLRVNEQTVRNWIDRGELPAVRVGARRVRVRQSALDRFIAAGEKATSTATDKDASAEAWGRVRVALADVRAAADRQDIAGFRQALDALEATASLLTKAGNDRPAGE